ncbi:acid-sensing ion channel 5 isoform X2 [Diabrotica virgifera virgifera]|uniref:Degenerin del-1-like n=2 Tax=Diabrotica virgifera virgifera TaxID=50390 RepID=A0ABM5JZF9_DIAVI|nr:acid-sensing ion channel 5 isoform X2 [Diabrotica virgifera virgifera]
MELIIGKECLKDPSQLIKFIVLFICGIFTFTQVTQCVKKFLYPPASTHSEFVVNSSVTYPCVTICRRPAYKTNLFSEFGIQSQKLDSSFAFSNFNFSNNTLTEFIEKATYRYDEIVSMFAFSSIGSLRNINVTSSFHFTRGRCYTFQSLNQSESFSPTSGFFFFLRHNQVKEASDYSYSNSPGYQLYLHGPNEVLTYSNSEGSSFIEYLDLDSSEEMSVKFEIQQFQIHPSSDEDCVPDEHYSKSKCEDYCIGQAIVNITNCTVPWLRLPPNMSFAECDDYLSVRNSIQYYINRGMRRIYLEQCNCRKPCEFTIYKSYIINRKPVDSILEPSCSIYIYCTNLIFRMTEVLSYDSNQLLSDIGGSLGFLLGLSVISLICIIEQVFRITFKIFFKRKVKKELKAQEIQSTKNEENDIIKNNIISDKKIDNEEEHIYSNLKNFVVDYNDFQKNSYCEYSPNENQNQKYVK